MKKEDAIEYFGSQCKLATFLGVAQGNLSNWKRIPPHYQEKIEAHTNGKLKAEGNGMKVRYMVTIEKPYIDLLKSISKKENIAAVEVIRRALMSFQSNVSMKC